MIKKIEEVDFKSQLIINDQPIPGENDEENQNEE